MFYFYLSFRKAAKYATEGVPGGLQNFVEWVIEFIDSSVRGSFTGKNPLVAPMALTLVHLDFVNESNGSGAS